MVPPRTTSGGIPRENSFYRYIRPFGLHTKATEKEKTVSRRVFRFR
ncbi:hypothetical protein HMPREF1554_01482 [Porphyromonas gingivalis F0569]|nr:hypothetical protein HMPREF1554_01482 [Porphyromonas gingivalis F0569]